MRATRDYQMRRRKESMDETRQRIVDAAVRLHGSVGPAQTTISAVAGEAGVQRSTVYRHFADETALFAACTSHWMASHPWPRPQEWTSTSDAGERLRRGLGDLYRFYDENERMIGNSFRDIEVMPAFVGEMMGALLQQIVSTLLEPFPAEAKQDGRFVAAVRAATDFRTARALADAGLLPAEAAKTAAEMVTGLAPAPSR